MVFAHWESSFETPINPNVESQLTIDFYCALCGCSLAVSRALQGNVVECPACSRSIPVPGRLNRRESVTEYLPLFSPEILSVEMTFACSGCKRSLLADARYEGERFSCPACDFSGAVPTWSGFVAADLKAKTEVPAVVLSAEELHFLNGDSEASAPAMSAPR